MGTIMKFKLLAGSRLRATRIIDSWAKPNDGTRTLIESAMLPELAAALRDWERARIIDCVLIGGLAVSFYGKARMTQDCDFLFLSPQSVPEQVQGFKRVRAHAFQHNATHVEIEMLDSVFLNIEQSLVDRIIETAVEHDGIKVASREGLICSKLGRFSRQDQADIEHLLEGHAVDLAAWPLSETERERFAQFS
jgi:hypothetical protein